MPRFFIEYVKNVQEPWELAMRSTWGIDQGQLLSIPFIVMGLWLAVRAMRRPREPLTYPDKFPDASSGQSFFSQVPRYSYYWKQGISEFHDKYRPADDTHSQWRGNLIVFLFFFILSYVVISAVLSTVVIRWLIPRRFVTEEFKKKRGSIIAAASATLFAIITMVISFYVQNLRFYASVNNLALLHNGCGKVPVDPEMNAGQGNLGYGTWGRTYPTTRSWSIGLQVTF